MAVLEFSRSEMIKFLTKDRYEVIIVDYYESCNEYHNIVVDRKRTMEIAYSREIPFDNFIANKTTYNDLIDWSIEAVFMREMKAKLLEL